MYRKIIIFVLLLVVGFIVYSVAMSRAPKHKPQEKIAAIDFSLNDISDEAHSLSDYKGKWVLLNFWASWCPPCRAEMPSMQKMYDQSDKEIFELLAVNVGQQPSVVTDFLEGKGYGFPVLLDENGRIAAQYGLRAFPTTFIIDPDGNIADKIVGAREWGWEEFKVFIKTATDESKS
ncbi:MAG: TlpA family protein disulfide reductase [Candidatus Margulisbacteria bacterium]|nr:TlpA family protein disulfide reductase [Candidatus Margulisiibacteriota bacterium]